MPYAPFQQRLEQTNVSEHPSLIKIYLAREANRQSLLANELDELIDKALQANPEEALTLFFNYPDLQEKYLTDSLKKLFLTNPSVFINTNKTHPYPKTTIDKLVKALKEDEDKTLFLSNIDSILQLTVSSDDNIIAYPLSLEDVLLALTNRDDIKVTVDQFNHKCYERIENDSFFTELFDIMFRNNGQLLDAYFKRFEGYHYQDNSFLLRHGELLNEKELALLLTHSDSHLFFKNALEIHGFTHTLVNWPASLLNQIKDTLLSYPGESTEEKALKIKWINKLIEYTRNHRKDERQWYQENLETLLNALKDIASDKIDVLRTSLRTWDNRDPEVVSILCQDNAFWLSDLNKTQSEHDASKISDFISAILARLEPSDFEALGISQEDLTQEIFIPLLKSLSPKKLDTLSTIKTEHLSTIILRLLEHIESATFKSLKTINESAQKRFLSDILENECSQPFKSLYPTQKDALLETLINLIAAPTPEAYDFLREQDTKKVSLIISLFFKQINQDDRQTLTSLPYNTLTNFISSLLHHANAKDLEALLPYPAVQAYFTNHDILKTLSHHSDEDFEALINNPSIIKHISGNSIQTIELTDDQKELVFSVPGLMARFQESKERELVAAIFDPKWDTKGIGFFGHKTPTNIASMRTKLGNDVDTIHYPLPEGLYQALIELANDASLQSAGCFFNTRAPEVQAFYSKVGDDTKKSSLLFNV